MRVKVKNIKVKHNGVVYLPGDNFEIKKEDYEKTKAFVEVVEEETKEKKAGGKDGEKK